MFPRVYFPARYFPAVYFPPVVSIPVTPAGSSSAYFPATYFPPSYFSPFYFRPAGGGSGVSATPVGTSFLLRWGFGFPADAYFDFTLPVSLAWDSWTV